MTGADPLFREEAVEHIRRGRGAGDVVRVAPRWTAIAFWALAALAVSVLVATTLIRVDRVRLAPAVAEPSARSVRAVVPRDDAPKPGERAEFAHTATGDRFEVTIREVAGAQSGAVTVTAEGERLSAGAGVLEIKVGERRLIADLVPGGAAER